MTPTRSFSFRFWFRQFRFVLLLCQLTLGRMGTAVAAAKVSGVGPSLSMMEFEEWLAIHKPNHVSVNGNGNGNGNVPPPSSSPSPYPSGKEFEKRKAIFEENRQRWHRLNQIPGGATYGPDREPYADRTPEEFARLVGTCYRETVTTASATASASDTGDARGGDNLGDAQKQGEGQQKQQRTRRLRTGIRVIDANETRVSTDSTYDSDQQHPHHLSEAFTIMDVDWRAHAPPPSPNSTQDPSSAAVPPPPIVSYVTPVKNQGPHGTCWSFAAAENLEGLGVRQGFPLANISEQEFISCCPDCQGRSADTTFAWLLDHTGGVPALEATYPYVGNASVPCRSDTAPRAPTTLHSWGRAHDDDGTGAAILKALQQHGPMGLGVDAKCFHGYQTGIVRECMDQSRNSDSDSDSDRYRTDATEKNHGPPHRHPRINHAVLMVAAGTDLYYYDKDHDNDGDRDHKLSFPTAVDFFAIKNSWGAHWGEDGYVRIERGTNWWGPINVIYTE